MALKKGGKCEDDDDLASSTKLQAILLADTFDQQQFRPITHQRPKVLLPLVNVPMIAYTLSWLQSNGVTEVFVFCCNHSKQILDYLETSQWLAKPNFVVSTIVSRTCLSSGDALRFIYEKNVIHTDFVLVNGDTITNMSLVKPLEEHRERQRENSNAIMTMVIKRSMPSPVTHHSRFGTDEVIIAIDPDTKQLLYYEDEADHLNVVSLDKSMLSENPPLLSLYSDRQDCCIDICSPQVLTSFYDNFDYQHIRHHFLKGSLLDAVEGYKIFTYEICSSYAARILNIRSYDAISKDIIQGWMYPLVPDVQFFENSVANLKRQGMCRASEVGLSCSAHIGPCTVIGSGTTIGTKTAISNSVVGESCSIGSNVTIDGCYIWNNVIVEDGCELKHAIVCDGVIVKAGASLQPGVVLSYKIVIGEQFVVPSYSKVSLLRQPIKQDSYDELDYTDDSSGGVADDLAIANGAITGNLGYNGIGFIWSINEKVLAEEWRHSMVPIPADKLVAVMRAADDNPEILTDDSDSEVANDDETAYFEKEVEETFIRAVEEDAEVYYVILEVNALRLSYNMTSLVCAGALFYSLMKFAFDTGHNSKCELYKNVTSVMLRWHELLKNFLRTTDEEIEILLKFEDICMDSCKHYTSLFEQILYFLYDKVIITEQAVLKWASEKEKADESDKCFVKKAKSFIQWLKEAPEED